MIRKLINASHLNSKTIIKLSILRNHYLSPSMESVLMINLQVFFPVLLRHPFQSYSYFSLMLSKAFILSDSPFFRITPPLVGMTYLPPLSLFQTDGSHLLSFSFALANAYSVFNSYFDFLCFKSLSYSLRFFVDKKAP